MSFINLKTIKKEFLLREEVLPLKIAHIKVSGLIKESI